MERNSFFDRIERKTNVKKEDIFNLAKTIQGKDLKDEDTLRNLIQEVSKLAGKEVPKEKENGKRKNRKIFRRNFVYDSCFIVAIQGTYATFGFGCIPGRWRFNLYRGRCSDSVRLRQQ